MRASPKHLPNTQRRSLRKGESMRLRTLAIAVVAVVVVVLAWSLVAQTQSQNKPPQFVQLTITTVKPSAINDYEEFVKKLNAARDKTPGSPSVSVYAVNLGGPAFTFYTVTQWEKWADRDKFPNGGHAQKGLWRR